MGYRSHCANMLFLLIIYAMENLNKVMKKMCHSFKGARHKIQSQNNVNMILLNKCLQCKGRMGRQYVDISSPMEGYLSAYEWWWYPGCRYLSWCYVRDTEPALDSYTSGKRTDNITCIEYNRVTEDNGVKVVPLFLLSPNRRTSSCSKRGFCNL